MPTVPNIAFSLRKNKKSKLKNMIKSFKLLHGESTQVGYFKSQGMHKGADGISDYSYTALAQALENGFFPMLSGTENESQKCTGLVSIISNLLQIYTIHQRWPSVNKLLISVRFKEFLVILHGIFRKSNEAS